MNEISETFKLKWYQIVSPNISKIAAAQSSTRTVSESATSDAAEPTDAAQTATATATATATPTTTTTTKRNRRNHGNTKNHAETNKINKAFYNELEDYLKDEFYNSPVNVYDLHLHLLKTCLTQISIFNKESAVFVNQTFANWHSQLKNHIQRKRQQNAAKGVSVEDEPGYHMTSKCFVNDEPACKCTLSQSHIEQAFDLALCHSSSNIFPQLNKIYMFKENFSLIKQKLYDSLKTLSFVEQADIIGNLDIQDKFNLDHLIIPLMLQNKYGAIDTFMNKNEQLALQIVDLCDRLCNCNLKDIEK